MTENPRFWTGSAAVCMLVGLVLSLTIGEGTAIALPAFALGAVCGLIGWQKERAGKDN